MENVLPFNNVSVRPLRSDGSSGDPRGDLTIEIKEEGQAFILRITDGMFIKVSQRISPAKGSP